MMFLWSMQKMDCVQKICRPFMLNSLARTEITEHIFFKINSRKLFPLQNAVIISKSFEVPITDRHGIFDENKELCLA
jgi:hypothetical protein